MADAVKANPEDYEVLWRASRYHVWLAENVGPDKKKAEAQLGWDLGDKARAVKPNGVEGNYFAACSVGLWSESVGILKALTSGTEGKFNDRLDKSIELDPKFDRSGPVSLKGRYFSTLPWPKRDLKKSKQWLERALAQSPQSLRIKYYLADTLLKDGEKEQAKKYMDEVMSGDDSYDPPEARLVRRLAKPTAKAIDEALK